MTIRRCASLLILTVMTALLAGATVECNVDNGSDCQFFCDDD